VKTGSPRMGVEVYTEDGGQGWYNITFRRCVVEVMDSHGLDFSDEPHKRSSGVLIEGCTIKGAGLTRAHWGSCLDFEYPLGVVVRNNVIYRGWEYAIQMTDRGDSAFSDAKAVFTGNRIDLTYDNGVTAKSTTFAGQVELLGGGNVWTDNVVIGN
jgi:hypothetical protein